MIGWGYGGRTYFEPSFRRSEPCPCFIASPTFDDTLSTVNEFRKASFGVMNAVGQVGFSGSDEQRARALELLDELGVADRRNVYPATLSGGERQRVAVARALMNRPALLLADEPTGALDSRSGEQVMDLLLDLNQIGQTLLIVTHDQRLATRCASRVVELADGQVTRERALERTA